MFSPIRSALIAPTPFLRYSVERLLNWPTNQLVRSMGLNWLVGVERRVNTPQRREHPMTKLTTRFALPEGASVETVREHLETFGAAGPPEVRPFERVYYDTFDWRLFNGGLVMEESGGVFQAYRLKTGEPVGQMDATGICFAWEMPAGELRDRLEPLIEMRALLPLVRVRGSSHQIPILNRDDKTVVRVAIEAATAYPPTTAEATPLPTLLTLQPVRGYKRELAALRDNLVEAAGMEPVTASPLMMAVTAAGREPGDYSSGYSLNLDPAMRADAATKLILATAFDSLQRNEAGVLADLDSEFLHDFRVAVRRTRSALAQIKDVLPQKAVDSFRTEFAWLGQITGPTRDLDVYLLEMDEFAAALPPYMQDRLIPLRRYLSEQREIELAKLVKALRSARYRKLTTAWQAFLDAPLEEQPDAPNALRPARELAQERIWRMVRRTRDDALAIDGDTPAETIHDLRKTAKKLRYLMEFFHSMYPRKKLTQAVAELKQMQNVLGEFQDRQVQIETLETFARDMNSAGGYPPETVLAMGALTGHLYTLEVEAREALPEHIDRFTNPKTMKLMRDLFKPAPNQADQEESG